MRLFMTHDCPFSQGVNISLKLREIGLEKVSIEKISTENPPPSLLNIDANGKTPSFEVEKNLGFTQCEIISQFLDSIAAAGPKLWGKTYLEIAHNQCNWKIVSENIITVVNCAVTAKKSSKKLKEIQRFLPIAEEKMAELLNDNQWIGGNTPNGIDACLAPFIWQFMFAKTFLPEIENLKISDIFTRYFTTIKSHSAFKNAMSDELAIKQRISANSAAPTNVAVVCKATRDLFADPSGAVKSLNCRLATEIFAGKFSPVWTLGKTARGVHMEITIELPNPQKIVAILDQMCDMQDSCDHHADVNIVNMKSIHLTLCTHEPHWGISAKDIALAEALTLCILT